MLAGMFSTQWLKTIFYTRLQVFFLLQMKKTGVTPVLC